MPRSIQFLTFTGSSNVSERVSSLPIAGDHATLARRYVGSLYALADQDGLIDAISTDFRALRRLWDECAEWRFVASDPRLSNEAVQQAVNQVAKISGLNALTHNFILVVAQNRRLSLLPSFIEGFLEEVAIRRGEYRVEVRSARALSPAQRETLSASLNAVMGGKINMNLVEDPTILGGLTVKLGSQFIDASIKTKLDHLERTLKGAA